MLEIASYMKDANILDLAAKTNARIALDESEQQTVAAFDEWAKEIGNTGYDKNHEIAAYVNRVITEAQASYPSQLIDMIFDRDSVGEFDYVDFSVNPKNTLKAFEALGGGNVERSFIDLEKAATTVTNLQVETDIKFAELRRNGWKTIALLTEYANSALENQLFYKALNAVDAAITSGADNYIDGTASAVVTQALIDQLSLYVSDWAEGSGTIVALSKFVQQISKLTGYSSFYSETMKDALYRNGTLPMYDGHNLYAVGYYRTLGNDGVTKMLPDKRVFGFAGKIGSIAQIGSIHTYESEDPNSEVVHLLVKDYKHAIAFYDMNRAAKIVLQ